MHGATLKITIKITELNKSTQTYNHIHNDKKKPKEHEGI
jgi:hypothetical protein